MYSLIAFSTAITGEFNDYRSNTVGHVWTLPGKALFGKHWFWYRSTVPLLVKSVFPIGITVSGSRQISILVFIQTRKTDSIADQMDKEFAISRPVLFASQRK